MKLLNYAELMDLAAETADNVASTRRMREDLIEEEDEIEIKKPKQPKEPKGTYLGRIKKTEQDKMPVDLRPRVKAALERIAK
jgi:hypothetical protein